MIPLAAAWAAAPAELLLTEARRAERERRWPDAMAACAQVVAEAPSSPEASACARHLAGWERRRDADGTFTSLGALEAARRGEQPPDVLAAWALDPAVPEVLRAEAAALRARAALDAGDPAAARALAAPWLAVDVGDPRVTAVVRAVDAEAAARQGGGGVEGTRAAHEAAQRVVRAVDRAAGLVGGAALAGLLLPAARGLDRRLRPWGAAVLLAAGGAGWALAEAWEPGAGRPVLPMVGGLVVVHLVALPALRAARPGWPRAAVRVAVAVASAAVAWLAVSRGGGLLALGVPV